MTWMAGVEPRIRVVTAVAVLILVISTPSEATVRLGRFLVILLAGAWWMRVSWRGLGRRCLVATPFLALAAGLLGWEQGALLGLSVLLKGYLAAIVVGILLDALPMVQLLEALRGLRVPSSLHLILTLMHRYTGILKEEYARLARARECRTVRPLGRSRYAVYGQQMGALLLRSLDRAERVHAAMVSRGFTGAWPSPPGPAWRMSHAGWAVFGVACFAGMRFGYW